MVNSPEVWVPTTVPSAIVWMHVIVVWVIETCISIVPRIIETAIPSTIIPRVLSVIPWIVITSVISSVVAAIVPRIISVTPWVVVTSVAPWARVIVVIPWRIPVI